MLFLENVSTLALFLSIYYVTPWLCCAIASEPPKMDLMLFKKFQRVIDNHKKYPKRFQEFSVLCQSKLKNHLWYLSERLVPLYIFSENTTSIEKKSIQQALLKFENHNSSTEMCMPDFESKAFTSFQLKDFVGADSWTFLIL